MPSALGRFPTTTIILNFAGDSNEAYSALTTLQLNMLSPAHQNQPLADALVPLEAKLVTRRPTINAALAAAAPDLQSILDSPLSQPRSM